mmetsp:Transcript_4507/g.13349  ORF Transcript_4507/g.13349 Transcript_4507/m.13349 type:complete len:336 (+) Transcript_4507:99-1106(+)
MLVRAHSLFYWRSRGVDFEHEDVVLALAAQVIHVFVSIVEIREVGLVGRDVLVHKSLDLLVGHALILPERLLHGLLGLQPPGIDAVQLLHLNDQPDVHQGPHLGVPVEVLVHFRNAAVDLSQLAVVTHGGEALHPTLVEDNVYLGRVVGPPLALLVPIALSLESSLVVARHLDLCPRATLDALDQTHGKVNVVRARVASHLQELVLGVALSQGNLLPPREVKVVQGHGNTSEAFAVEEFLKRSHEGRLAAALRRAEANAQGRPSLFGGGGVGRGLFVLPHLRFDPHVHRQVVVLNTRRVHLYVKLRGQNLCKLIPVLLVPRVLKVFRRDVRLLEQ